MGKGDSRGWIVLLGLVAVGLWAGAEAIVQGIIDTTTTLGWTAGELTLLGFLVAAGAVAFYFYEDGRSHAPPQFGRHR